MDTTETPGRTPFRRTDTRMHTVVDQAIASLPAVGLKQAAQFLAAMAVPAPVAVRTLVYPQLRRH